MALNIVIPAHNAATLDETLTSIRCSDELQTAIAVAPFGAWPLADRSRLQQNMQHFPARLSALFQHIRSMGKVLSEDGIHQVE